MMLSKRIGFSPYMNAALRKSQIVLTWLIWSIGFSFYAQAQTNTEAVEHRLASTIIPDLKFHDTPISDAIQTIRSEFCRRAVDHQSFSVFLKQPRKADSFSKSASSPSPTSPVPELRITLAIHNMSVLEALRSVAAMVGMKVKIEAYAVSIVPEDELTAPLSTVVLKVTPEFVRSLDKAAETSSGSRRVDARAWLEKAGMTFPPGASAFYSPDIRKLVIRNTQANLDLVEDIDRFDEKANAPTPANP